MTEQKDATNEDAKHDGIADATGEGGTLAEQDGAGIKKRPKDENADQVVGTPAGASPTERVTAQAEKNGQPVSDDALGVGTLNSLNRAPVIPGSAEETRVREEGDSSRLVHEAAQNTVVPTLDKPEDINVTNQAAKVQEQVEKELSLRLRDKRGSVFASGPGQDREDERTGEVEQAPDPEEQTVAFYVVDGETTLDEVATHVGLVNTADLQRLANANGIFNQSYAISKGARIILPTEYTYDGIEGVRKKPAAKALR
jgi:hypothetical protein